MTRRYQQQQRALSAEETRARIIEATMALHEDPGPKATTISAIAERAGVQRLTVYRHFPDDAALFQACSSLWTEKNPPPDPATWAEIAEPRERARAALGALYRFFRKSRAMLTSVLRDEPDVPAITPNLDGLRSYLDGIAADLAKELKGERARALTTLRHVVRFQTWVSLSELCGSDKDAADLATSWVFGASSHRAKSGSRA